MDTDLSRAAPRLDAPRVDRPRGTALLEAALRSSLVLVFAMEVPDLTLQFVSANVSTILGYEPEEVIGRPGWWTAQLHPEEATKIIHLLERSLATGRHQGESELRFRHRDGSYRWFHTSVSLDQDQGSVLVGYAVDITERRIAEDNLRAAERRYRSLVQTSPDGIVVHRDGAVVFANSAAARILGARSAEDLVGRPVTELVHPDFRDVVRDRIRSLMADGTSAPLIEERFLRVDGSEVEVEVSANLLVFEGEPAVLAVFRDITHRKETERALGEAEAKYRALVEQLPAVVYLGEYGEEGDWLYVSPQLERMLGYTPEEWLAHPHPMTSFTHPDDLARFRIAEERSRQTGEDLSQEVRMQRRDGTWVWILNEASAVEDGSGAPLFLQGLMYDVTERKRVEEQLRSSEELVRKLFGRLVDAHEQERARIAADFHDDSIQVVTAVGLRLAALRGMLTDEEQIRTVSRLQETVGSAIARMRNLLFELRPRVLDEDGLAATLRQYLDMFAAQTGAVCTLDNQLAEEPPRETRIALYRIALEALTNVRKHAQASRVRVAISAEDQGFHVCVQDDGVGFSTEENGAPGHLGLSSMIERAELAGGWCRIESAPGKGTTVRYWLPAQR